MKQLLFLLFVIGSTVLFGQKKVRIFLDQKQFLAPSIGNFIELQFEYDVTSIQFVGRDNGLIAELAVDLKILQENKEVKRDSYRLNSPLMRDSIIENFYDIRRYALNPGKYTIELKLFDVNAEDQGVNATIPISVVDLANTPSISSIQSIEYAVKSDQPESPFFKSGLDIVPKLSTYYPQDLDSYPYYIEIYGSETFSRPIFGVKQKLIDSETEKELPEFTQFFKLDTGRVVPMLRKLDLTNLFTGSYRLDLVLLNGNMEEVYTSSTKFERSNEVDIQLLTENVILDPNFEASIPKDSALFYLASLIPIAKAETQRSILNTISERNPEKALKTIQSFWIATASSTSAYGEWIKYKQQVLLVQRKFKTNFQDGYETDRGRVYLQYGSPTTLVQREASASEYPYEIWQYNKIGRFSNKRFIFYNPDLIGANYSLLHSDMIGEIRNNNWPLALNQRNSSRGNVDDPNQNVDKHYGGSSNDLFRQY
ncbi:MAG: GWxTD domain-containing protein [Bacteroidetes bacterium]|nr:GWxTD domain-containing protein [Bacteroidota bacterium]